MRSKLFIALIIASFVSIPVWAEEQSVQLDEQVVEQPDQTIQNTKSYTGVNYNRQDSTQVGRQQIINDHSWFNFNVNIIKEGALFKKESK